MLPNEKFTSWCSAAEIKGVFKKIFWCYLAFSMCTVRGNCQSSSKRITVIVKLLRPRLFHSHHLQTPSQLAAWRWCDALKTKLCSKQTESLKTCLCLKTSLSPSCLQLSFLSSWFPLKSLSVVLWNWLLRTLSKALVFFQLLKGNSMTGPSQRQASISIKCYKSLYPVCPDHIERER